MSSTRCYYHPEKTAVTVCERCHRPICLEDKRVYRKTHYSNTGFNNDNYYGSNTYVTTHDYCPLCYASQKQTNVYTSIIGGIIFVVFIIIGLGFFASISNSFSSSSSNFNQNPSYPQNVVISGVTHSVMQTNNNGSMLSMPDFSGIFAFFIIIAVCAIIGGIIYSKMQADSAVDEAMRFKRNLKTSQSSSSSRYVNLNTVKPLYQKKKEVGTINCFECGSPLSLDDQFCPSCGDSTKDEIQAYSNDENMINPKFLR